MSELIVSMAEARERFMVLVADVRPALHRYCTRMTGSVFDGEDIVQDTLAKAFYALAEMESPPPLRPWLFRIAHNTALDHLRRHARRHVEADMDDIAAPDDGLPDGARVEAALQVFATLPPVQRSALALKDVLGLSLEETADTMGLTVGAVKAALVRARARVAATHASAGELRDADVARLRDYAHRFNQRDWDGLRTLFGEETRLDLISRHQRVGRSAAQYFTRYAEAAPAEALRAEAGWVGGQPVLAMFRGDARTPAYFIQIDWRDGGIARVRDFRHVPYIADEAKFTTTPTNEGER